MTACCLAASVVGDPAVPRARQARVLMSCLGVLSAVHPVGKAPTMAGFREGLKGHLRHLLPNDLDVSGIAELKLLDQDGSFSDEAEDLCGEFLVPAAALEEHWPWQRVAAEQEERRLFEMLRRLPQGEYARLRAELVERPTGDLRVLRRTWDSLLSRFYEPIAQWPGRQVRGWFFPCPLCRWPMRVLGTGPVVTVRCEAHVRRGVSYACRPTARENEPPLLRPTGKAATRVDAQPATSESFAVSRVAWRYMTLPGLLECELRDHALGLRADVVMWPHRDLYDLAIKLGENEWLVDVKTWASPRALGEALRACPPAASKLVVVIPDHQRKDLHLVRQLVDGCGYRVLTAQQLKKELADAAGRPA
ncbi:hypothetical protein [Lentzea aerocolonigenes]|uniref:restriction endonuclease-related protein n=2 Tax=Lentzea aerocolonigenes TaxID=68170 RepID=UPI001F45CDAB|nr:hypothetical protein [Lentzea aerocolonigenes]